MNNYLALVAAMTMLSIGGAAFAAMPGTIDLEIKDGKIYPANVEMPAGQKVEVRLMNSQKTRIELVGDAPDREVEAKPGITTKFMVGPLRAGNYDVFDKSHPDVRATIIVQ